MNQQHLSHRAVSVVAWEFQGGTGFDWYRTRQAADDAFAVEMARRMAASARPWSCFRFDVKVPLRLSDAAVNDLICLNLEEYCASAEVKCHANVLSTADAECVACAA